MGCFVLCTWIPEHRNTKDNLSQPLSTAHPLVLRPEALWARRAENAATDAGAVSEKVRTVRGPFP